MLRTDLRVLISAVIDIKVAAEIYPGC